MGVGTLEGGSEVVAVFGQIVDVVVGRVGQVVDVAGGGGDTSDSYCSAGG